MCFFSWLKESFKEFWKEFLLLFLLNTILVYGFPLMIAQELNSGTSLMQLLHLFFPFIIALFGGFMASQKTRELKTILLIPLSAVFFSLLAIALIEFLPALSLTESDWTTQLDSLNSAYGTGIALNEFKTMTLLEASVQEIDFIFSGIGLAFAGAGIGAIIEKKLKNGKKRKQKK